MEAVEQFTRALAQIATLRGTPALRREEIKLQVALITPLIHVKGWAAPETKATAERARLLIEQAEALGEPAEDPLLLFSVLYEIWAANFVAFNGDAMRSLAGQFVTLAEKQGATVPLMIGHRLMGTSLLVTGGIAENRTHFDQAIALYDPVAHRALATRFSQDHRVSVLPYRAFALWALGYPEAALADAERAISDARAIGQAATLMYALVNTSFYIHVTCGNYATANMHLDELVTLADEKGSFFWKAIGMAQRGCVMALTGKASDAVHVLTSGITASRSTGATLWMPLYLSCLARAHFDLGKFDDAWRCIGEAMTAVRSAVRNRRSRANSPAISCRADATRRFTPPAPINCVPSNVVGIARMLDQPKGHARPGREHRLPQAHRPPVPRGHDIAVGILYCARICGPACGSSAAAVYILAEINKNDVGHEGSPQAPRRLSWPRGGTALTDAIMFEQTCVLASLLKVIWLLFKRARSRICI